MVPVLLRIIVWRDPGSQEYGRVNRPQKSEAENEAAVRHHLTLIRGSSR